jgi:hypothetical protein
MQLNSLYCYFPYEEAEFNKKFRNEVRIKIIKLLQSHPDGLTDTEMGVIMGFYPNLNKNRPRRNDLSNPNGKFKLLEERGSKLNSDGNREIIWGLSSEKLYKFMRE